MADKQITELPANSGVTNETLFPSYQPGAVEPAQKVSGAQFRAFAEQAGAAAGEQAAGDLARGGTFTPHFDPATGVWSWTNDIGLPNPEPVQVENVSSVNGKTGAVTLSAADVGAVNKAGDTIAGELVVAQDSDASSVRLNPLNRPYKGSVQMNVANETLGLFASEVSTGQYTGLLLAPPNIWGLNSLLRLRDGDGNFYNVHHTGNKPSGSYTGNGDATARDINIGGIGFAVIIRSNSNTAIITSAGGIVASYSTVTPVTYSEAHFSGGYLTLATTNAVLNTNGQTYQYQVL